MTGTRPAPDPPHASNVCARARSVSSRFDLGRTCRTHTACPAVEAAARPVRRVRRSSYGTGQVHAGLSSASWQPPRDRDAPRSRAPRVHLGPLVRRWVRRGVRHTVRGRARPSTPSMRALTGHVWAEGAGRRRSPSRPRPRWARSSALASTTRSRPEMPQVMVMGW